MRWWKVLGLAAVAGVLAGGVAAQRSRRTWKSYDTAALRARLHERLERAEADAATDPRGTGSRR